MSAPTYFNSASNPADNSAANEPTTLTITPPGSMVAGDLVVVVCGFQIATTGQVTVAAAGGQAWSSVAEAAANDCVASVFWCQYDGTWDTSPGFAFAASGGTQPCSAVMHVFRPSAVGVWEVDTAFAGGAEASASPTVIAGITPSQADTVTLAGWLIPNASTWGTLSGTGWAVTGAAQYRNTAGTDISLSFAHNLKGAPSATNDVSKVPSTAAAGVSFTMAWRNALPPTIALNTADATDFGTDTTPTLEATATDGNAQDVRYNFQIADDPSFSTAGGTVTPIDEYLATVNSFSAHFEGGTIRTAQSFWGDGGTLGSVTVSLSKNNSPGGNVVVTIYANDGGTYGGTMKPTGSALATSDAIAASTLTTSAADYTFTFSGANQITLTKNTGYFAAVEYTATSAGDVRRHNLNPGTATGTAHSYTSSWSSAATWDYTFKIERASAPVLSVDATYGFANGDTDSGISNTGATEFAQSFHGFDGPLDSVRFKARRNGTGTGTLYAKLYAHDGGTYGGTGKPTGSALATSAAVNVADLPTSHVWVVFTFSGADRYTLQSGVDYYIALTCNDSSTNSSFFQVDNSTPTADGNRCAFTSPTWTGFSSDMVFEVRTTRASTVLDKVSGTDSGFANTVTGGDTDPFNSGEKVGFTVQAGDALDGGTWYWRARASDPNGSNEWSGWAAPRTFDISEGNGGEYVAAGGIATGGAAVLAKGRSWIAAAGATTGGAAGKAKGRSWIAAGGLATSGAATTLKATSRAWVAAGGITTSGAAGKSKGKAFAPSGGIATSGAAGKSKGRSWIAAGGIVASGAALVAKSRQFIASGGLVTSGVALTAKGRSWIASGGLVSGGAGIANKGKAFAAAGGALTSGAAATLYTPGAADNTYEGSGGVVVAGAAVTSKARSWIASGSLVSGGAGIANKGKAFAASGGAIANGAAAIAKGKAAIATGGASTSGAATTAKGKAFAASGGAVTGGAAATSLQTPASQSYVGSGGAVVAGAAVLAKGRSWIAAGAAVVSGAALRAKGRQWFASGGLVAAGAAATSLASATIKEYSGSGGAVTGGAATLAKGKVTAASGGALVSGAAGLSKGRSWRGAGGLLAGGAAATSLATASSNSYVGSGGIVTSGAATLAKGRSAIAAGGCVVSGSAVTSRTSARVFVGSGGFVVGGVAALSRVKVFLPSGGLAPTGAAGKCKGKVYTVAGGAVSSGAAACAFTSALDTNVAGAVLPVSVVLVVGGVECHVVVQGTGLARTLAILPGVATAGPVGVGITPAGSIGLPWRGTEALRRGDADVERRGDDELIRTD